MLEKRARAILEVDTRLMSVLHVAASMGWSDWMVFSGAVYQPILNYLTGRPAEYGLKDYDLAYFDASDLSYEAEDTVIRRVNVAMPETLRPLVETRNQARVHLWFEPKFGEPYSPLGSCSEALSRFVSPLFAIGVWLDAKGSLRMSAPFGLEDLFGLRLRPNPLRPVRNFNSAAQRVQERWPELRLEA